MALSIEEIRARLEAFLARETGSSVSVTGVKPLAGGASRASFALDAHVASGPQAGRWPAVLRLDLGGKIYQDALEREEEHRVIECAARGGVPVPQPWWRSSDSAVLGRSFFIMSRVEGETIGRRIVQLPELAAARAALPAQMGRALARVHALDPRPLSFLPGTGGGVSGGVSAVGRVLAQAERELAALPVASPGLWAGLRWLERHAPGPGESVLVHGDFRLGNMVVGPEGLRAVLDWEFAAIGDPHEDLAWPFVRDWRFGNDRLRFAGLSDGADFLEAYRAAGGRAVDADRLSFWEAAGNLRWALGCLTQANRHLSGEERSVELASLGRRSAEMELEMLDCMDHLARRTRHAGPS